MSNIIKVKIDNGVLDYSDNATIQVLRAQYQNLTEPEFANFLTFCMSTKLNPFKREIWAIKPNSYTDKNGKLVQPPVQIMVGFNGYLTVANRHSDFDGMTTKIDREEGKLISSTTTVFRKDRKHPSEVTVYLAEFYKQGYNGKPSTWDKMPIVMLTKVSKSHALREAFSVELGGTYIPEEMPSEFDEKNATIETTATKVVEKPQITTEEQPKMIAHYDLTTVPSDKLDNAILLLKKAGAMSTDEELNLYWESPVVVTRLEPYRLGAEVAA